MSDPGNGWSSVSRNERIIGEVCATITEMYYLEASIDTVFTILREYLETYRMTGKFELKLLSNEQKQYLSDVAQYENDTDFLKTIITGYETWLYTTLDRHNISCIYTAIQVATLIYCYKLNLFEMIKHNYILI